MVIKVCGMREPANMLALEKSIQPDWMGLIFYAKSPRFVSSEIASKTAEIAIPKVGVFVNESLDYLLERINEFQLAAVQLHGNESAAFVKELKLKTDVKIWKVISVGSTIDWETMRDYVGLVDCFLFDTATKNHGGSGKKFNWQLLHEYPFDVPFLLSGGIDEDSVSEIKKYSEVIPQLIGVDLNSKFEDKLGIKNIEKLKAFKNTLLK